MGEFLCAAGAVEAIDLLDVPRPGNVVGAPPQWSDDSDATYARITSGEAGVEDILAYANITPLGVDPATVTGMSVGVRATIEGFEDGGLSLKVEGVGLSTPALGTFLGLSGPFGQEPIQDGAVHDYDFEVITYLEGLDPSLAASTLLQIATWASTGTPRMKVSAAGGYGDPNTIRINTHEVALRFFFEGGDTGGTVLSPMRAHTGVRSIRFVSTSGVTEIPPADDLGGVPSEPVDESTDRVTLTDVQPRSAAGGASTYGSVVETSNNIPLVDADDASYVDLRADADDVGYVGPDSAEISLLNYTVATTLVSDLVITMRMQSDWPDAQMVTLVAGSDPAGPGNILGVYEIADGPLALGDYVLTLEPSTTDDEKAQMLASASRVWVYLSGDPGTGSVKSTKIYEINIDITGGAE